MELAIRYVEDPASRDSLYEEVKVEAALVKIVCGRSLSFSTCC